MQNTWNVENFLSILHLSLKFFKIEITTFLEELGNFKHFEPYFIFDPHDPPLNPPGGPKTQTYGHFSAWGIVARSNEEPKIPRTQKSLVPNFFPLKGVKFMVGGVGGSFFDQFPYFQSKSKSASLPGSDKVIGLVQTHSSYLQSPIWSLWWKPGT